MNDSTPDVPRIGAGVLAVVAVAVATSFAIAVAIRALQVWPFVLLVTLAIAALAGLPLFALVRRARRQRSILVAASGFATGASLPLLMALLGPAADQASVGGSVTVTNGSYSAAGWLQMLDIAAMFGFAGAVSALAAWRLSLWLSPATNSSRRARRLAAGLATVAMAASSFAVPRLYVDRSCHNPMRDGRTSIGPVASFALNLPQRDWPTLDGELRRFALQRGWSVQADDQPKTAFPWYQQSLCVEPGTQITIMNNAPEPLSLSVDAYQPQGGSSWQSPLHALQRQLEARWPGSTSYRYDAYASPRPPWAPLAPSPALSSAAR